MCGVRASTTSGGVYIPSVSKSLISSWHSSWLNGGGTGRVGGKRQSERI